jgi:uncharacterized protein (DUF433 family)
MGHSLTLNPEKETNMKAIEINATISKDRILILQLPRDVQPGQHHIFVVIGEKTFEPKTSAQIPVKIKESLPIIISEPDVMGGTPVFAGTRVPFQTLIDYLKGGESIEDFLEGFPTVSRKQVIAFLEEQPKQPNL